MAQFLRTVLETKPTDGTYWSVLEVDSRSRGKFSELKQQKVLVNEINHRVKNSLRLVASVFSLQATAPPERLRKACKMRLAA